MREKLILVLILLLAFFLRFYRLGTNPPSLYWEEVALGYDAYSLIKTGHDHRGNIWPIVSIQSYMDFKPPLYVYATIPSIVLFGLNEFSVRFPSAFFGLLTVLIMYFLAKEISKNLKLTSRNFPLIASFLIAISPWHLQLSRAAFEANLALFLITSGLLFFLLALRKSYFLIISSLFFSLSFYCYHAARVFTPIILIALLLIYFKKLWQFRAYVFISLTTFFFLSLPLIISLNSRQVNQRFQETSAFTDLTPIIKSNLEIKEDGSTRIAKIIHHRFFEYGKIFLTNYVSHFTGNFLFLSGDSNSRHSTQEFGALYHWEIFGLLLGLVFLIKNLKRISIFLFSWLIISPIPAALTVATPHALRFIFGLPVLVIISSLGYANLLNIIKNWKIRFIFFLIVITDFIVYLHFYYAHYPKLDSDYWQYGYKQAMTYARNNENKYDAIYITNYNGRAYMYYLFYFKKDPAMVQNLINPHKDNPDIPQIGKAYFNEIPKTLGKILWIAQPGTKENGTFLTSINDLNDQRVFEIWETY